MPFYMLTLICMIFCAVFALAGWIAESKRRKNTNIIMAFLSFLGAMISLLTLEVPEPAIYTTNGNQGFGNEVYFETEWPLTVWYTTVPYDDPKQNGIKYKENIPVSESMSLSAKASFLGIRWSKLETRDIVIGEKGEISIVDSKEPGSSIKEIRATLKTDKLFPGNKITKEIISVEGITINEDIISISDFEFSPEFILEGANELTVSYNGFSHVIRYTSQIPSLKKISAKYIGDGIQQGDKIRIEEFQIIGTYEDGRTEDLSEYNIEPSVADEAGQLPVTITKDGVSTSILVTVEEKPSLFSNVFESHKPNDVATGVKFEWWDSEKYKDLKGEVHKDGGVFLSISNMFNIFGSGVTNPVSSEVHLVLNPECTDRDFFSGDIVVENTSAGSAAKADISVLVDGEVKWQSESSITGDTIEPVHFNVDVSEAKTEVIIKTECIPKGDGLAIGIVNLSD